MSHYGDDQVSYVEQGEGLFRADRDDVVVESGFQAEAAPAPSAERYEDAFRRLGELKKHHMRMLQVHYHATARTITATQLAHAFGYGHYSFANKQYGELGRLVGEQLEYRPEPQHVGTLVTFDKRMGEWHWLMRPEVAEALESLGWVEAHEILLPEEISPTAAITFVEGAFRQVMVNAYERNHEARRLCIEHYGTNCCICGFDFGAMYGEMFDGFIHVHHIRPLSEIAGEYVVNPVEDLRPVCPNCHAVLHRRTPPYGIEEVKGFLQPDHPTKAEALAAQPPAGVK